MKNWIIKYRMMKDLKKSVSIAFAIFLAFLLNACAQSFVEPIAENDSIWDASLKRVADAYDPRNELPNESFGGNQVDDRADLDLEALDGFFDFKINDDQFLLTDQQIIDQQIIDMAIPMDMAPPPPPPPTDCERIRVVNTGTDGLKLRPGPNRSQASILVIPDQSILDVISLEENGEDIMGNNDWYEVSYQGNHGFVSAYYTTCVSADVVDPPPPVMGDAFLLPYACGTTHRVSQGNNGNFSHNGRSAYAIDFSLGLDTPLLAMKGGRVVYTRKSTRLGDPCYDGGGRECINEANYVVIEHNDSSRTAYLHLNRVDVSVGDQVGQGQQVGLSGSTGYSTGPHGHVERQGLCNGAFCQTIELSFADVPGGIPQTGQNLTSGNCH
jgi:hypothetical protein